MTKADLIKNRGTTAAKLGHHHHQGSGAAASTVGPTKMERESKTQDGGPSTRTGVADALIREPAPESTAGPLQRQQSLRCRACALTDQWSRQPLHQLQQRQSRRHPSRHGEHLRFWRQEPGSHLALHKDRRRGNHSARRRTFIHPSVIQIASEGSAWVSRKSTSGNGTSFTSQAAATAREKRPALHSPLPTHGRTRRQASCPLEQGRLASLRGTGKREAVALVA